MSLQNLQINLDNAQSYVVNRTITLDSQPNNIGFIKRGVVFDENTIVQGEPPKNGQIRVVLDGMRYNFPASALTLKGQVTPANPQTSSFALPILMLGIGLIVIYIVKRKI